LQTRNPPRQQEGDQRGERRYQRDVARKNLAVEDFAYYSAR
jgi:hypothetical protein